MLSSEGGHIGLASVDPLQFEFEQFSKKKFGLTNEIISAEWLFCGKGIPHLYEFYSMREGRTMDKPLAGEQVFALIETDPVARQCFQHFLKMLGTCLAHFTAAFLPDNGIFLSGTILSSVIKHIQADVADQSTSILINAFHNNICLRGYLQTVPLYFTPEEDLGLKGCWNFLQLLSL